MSDEVLTIKEVAQYLKVNERTIYRLAASGELPGFRVGNAWRFKQIDLVTWVAKQTQKSASKE
ncbi:DNA-binding protein [Thiopseudomonas alkaliphila]|uniref:helix-turn-helix domain-containing protein n=1 Tax=Thiopseudomonas alkaliphila TaxID=1697053 RepID=UPI00069D688E|nr:helix-turn-helix domain-containing protein [Thiopseudomonas alkaliphila]AKX47390.1 DNA-binding protein [Thiopseudomonas alkaliphila]AKX48400.1 DNA-binding protein [Thiopseudomonas alkaliphila]